MNASSIGQYEVHPAYCAMCKKDASKPRMQAFDSRYKDDVIIRICSEMCFEKYRRTLECYRNVSKKAKDLKVEDIPDMDLNA